MERKQLSQHGFKIPPVDLQAHPSTQAIRSIPELIDYNARVNPEHIFCHQAVKADGAADEDRVRGDAVSHASPTVSITMRQLQGAIAQCTRRLLSEIPTVKPPRRELDGSITKSGAVALLLESDVTLLLHLFALLALGVPVVLLSARLSSAAIDHLLQAADVKYIITSTRLAKAVKPSSTGSLTAGIHIAKSFAEDVTAACQTESTADAPISHADHYICENDRQVLILHSSGTTGLPKAIPQSHKYFLGYSVCHHRTDAEIVDGLNVTSLPFYHAFGLVAACISLGIGKPLWIPPSHIPVTGASTARALREVGAKSLMTVPQILEEICALPEDDGISSLLPLQFVASGGGPLKISVGEKLHAAGVKVLAHFGSTETGPLAPFTVPAPDYDWHFWTLRKDCNLSIKPVDQGDKDQEDQIQYQLVVRPFGWDTDFVLQDRLITSKNSPGRDFRVVGRNDDLIILNTGEKVSPRILENLLCESELVRSAVAFGNGQFELGVIVEPVSASEDPDHLKSQIWPLIEEAGRQMDDHARISSKASIIVTAADLPLPRSDKGSILREEVYRVYGAEIKKAYKTMEESNLTASVKWTDLGSLEESLRTLVENVIVDILPTGNVLKTIEDVFELGANSLHAVRIRRAIRNAMKENSGGIGMDFVYKNPTVQKMAAAIQSMQTADSKRATDEGLTEEYTRLYSLPPSDSDHVILLTGANGSLGSHLLRHLAGIQSVSQVICLGRVMAGGDTSSNGPSTGRDGSATKLKEIVASHAHKSKIVFLRGDPNKPQLALQDDVYSSLCNTVTHIVHAAWPMDFQQMLPSFQTQFRFLQSLLQLCRDSHCVRPAVKPRFVFVSSIAVVGQYLQSNGSSSVPEVPMGDLSSTNDLGYGKAKYVCEKIIEDAAKNCASEMEVTFVRVGQISGSSESGFWNSKEHFPALVRLSKAIGKYPRVKGSLSWLPVDTAATVLSEILLTKSSLDLVYHMENPVRQDFESVMSRIAAELEDDRPDDTANTAGRAASSFVELEEWHADVSKLIDAAAAGSEDAAAGAVAAAGAGGAATATAADEMLSQFFKEDFRRMAGGSVVLDTSNTRRVSPTLRAATQVDGDTIAKYVRAWRRAGVFGAGGRPAG